MATLPASIVEPICAMSDASRIRDDAPSQTARPTPSGFAKSRISLDDLERRGLIVRDQHPMDRRRHAVGLSGAGRARLARLREAGTQAEFSFLEPPTPAERRLLHALLRKLLPA